MFKKPLIINAYTYREEILRHAHIESASKFLPDWWKELSPEPTLKLDEKTPSYYKNMRHCAGFLDLYRHGFMVPLWSDLLVELGEKGSPWLSWQFSDEESDAVVHQAHQRGSFLDEKKYQHLKLQTPWILDCKEDIDWIVAPPSWNISEPDDMIVPTGIVNFKYQRQINANMFMRRGDTNRVVHLEFGQPLLQMIPLTERKVIMNHHLIGAEKWKNMKQGGMYSAKFIGSYYKLKDRITKGLSRS